jgi:hypothetical protein
VIDQNGQDWTQTGGFVLELLFSPSVLHNALSRSNSQGFVSSRIKVPLMTEFNYNTVSGICLFNLVASDQTVGTDGANRSPPNWTIFPEIHASSGWISLGLCPLTELLTVLIGSLRLAPCARRILHLIQETYMYGCDSAEVIQSPHVNTHFTTGFRVTSNWPRNAPLFGLADPEVITQLSTNQFSAINALRVL